MGAATVIPPGAGEVIGDSPDRRVELLSDHDSLHATWSRFGPGREGADLHVHRRHHDLFYVLEGEMTIRLGPGGEPVTVAAGTLARLPPLVIHGFRNASGAELRFLNLHAPGQGFADYMRALRDGRSLSYDQHDPPADGGRPPSAAVFGGPDVLADEPGLRVALLADVEEIAISEACCEPGDPSPPAHVHERHIESLYVLDGELTLTAGDRDLRATAGTWLQVPAGTPHTLAFTGDEPVRFLELHTPGSGFGDFLRALHDARDERAAGERAGFDQEPAA
jgi:mannose-6-phosphate isomerase-like protein (cupin superfamily)